MQTAILCEHIVHDFHGPVVGKVATILLERGQLNYAQLARLLRVPNPSLSHTQLRAALVVLIQQNMVSHSLGPAQDMYQISKEEIVARLWFGEFIGMAEEAGGVASRILIRAALLEGKIRVGQLLKDARAAVEGDDTSTSAIYPALVWLIQHRYLTPLTDLHYLTSSERYFLLQKQAMKGMHAPSAKQKREAETNARMEYWDKVAEEKEKAYAQLMDGVEAAIAESGSSARPAKRRRKEGGQSVEERGPQRLDIQSGLNEGVYLRVNYDRFLFKMRNKLIEGAARNKFGRAGGRIMRAILSLIEDGIEHRPSTQKLTVDLSETVTSSQIIDRLSQLEPNGPSGAQQIVRSAFVSSCIVPTHVEESGTWTSASQNTLYLVAELCERMAYTDDMAHLTNLRRDDDPMEAAADRPAKRDCCFLTKVENTSAYGGAKGNEGWKVDFFASHLALRKALVQGVVQHRLGRETVRVMRILDEHGRLEEKHVQKIALTSAKETRRHIDILLQAGLIESQEVPKTADRLPSRSFYLWYLDWTKMADAINGQVLQQLANLRQRQRAEQQRWETLLIKSRRTDVQQDKSLMKQEEWDEIEALDTRVEYLGVAEMRTMSDYLVLTLPLAVPEARMLVPEADE